MLSYTPNRRHWPLALLVVVMFLMPLSGAMADSSVDGTDDTGSRAQGAEDVGAVEGKINYYKNGYPGKANVLYTMNLSFSIERNANHNEILGYIGRVNDFHAKFYDATDGQMAIEKVDVWNNKRFWDYTDVRFYTQSGRAFTFRGGISSEDAHIYLFGGNGGKVLHHEWGHYAMFLPDEYTDSGGPFCTCIMGSTWNTDNYCTDTNHNTGSPFSEAKSCWQQIADRYDHIVEKDPPVGGPWDEPVIDYVWHEILDIETKDSNMTIFPATPTKGDDLFINVSFHNLNYSIDGVQKFTLFRGDPGAGGVPIDDQLIDVSGLEDFTITWQRKAVEGLNDFYVVADPNNTVSEVNENNNQAKGQVYVNVPPAIDPSIPGTFFGSEDEAIEVDLTDYELDVEDTGPDLSWTIMDYDNNTIVDLVEDTVEDNFIFTPLKDWYGITKVDARLTDSAGAYVDVSFTLDFESVNDLPLVSELERDMETMLRGGSIEISMRGSDIETEEKFLTGEIEVGSPSGEWTPLQVTVNNGFMTTFSTTYESEPGSYSLKGKVIDAHNGESDWTYLNDTFNVTNNFPTIMGMVIPEDMLYRTESISIQVAASDLEDGPEDFIWDVEMEYPDGEWKPIETELTYGLGYHQFDFTPDEEAPLGVYHFKAVALDKDGGTTGWLEDATDVMVMNNVPVAGDIETSLTELFRTETMEIVASGTDVEQAGDELIPEFMYSFGATWSHEYLGDASFDTLTGEWKVDYTPPATSSMGGVRFKVRFTDADGDSSEWIESKAIQVKNNPPIAVIDGPVEGKVGKEIKFFGSNSSDIESEVSYGWTFGDGQASNQADPVVEYRRHGTYEVLLTVKDPNGITDSASLTITVAKKPTPPPSIIGTPGQSSLFGGLGLIGLLALIIVIVVVAIMAAVMMKRRKDAGWPPPVEPENAGGFVPLSEETVPDDQDDKVPDDDVPPPGPPDKEGAVPEAGGEPDKENGPIEEKRDDPPPPGPPPPGPPTSSDSPSS